MAVGAEPCGGAPASRPARRSSSRARWVTAAAAAATLCLLLTAGPAAASDDPRIVAVDRSRHPDVGMTVVVPVEPGGDVLAADAFSVEEDGTEHRVERVMVPAGADMEIVLLVDAPAAEEERRAIQAAIVEFMLTLPAGTWVAIVGAGEQPRVFAALTDDLQMQISGARSLGASAGGSIYDAIPAGLGQFSDRTGVSRNLVLLAVSTAASRTSPERLTASVDAAGAAFYGVRVEPAPPPPFEPPSGSHVARVWDASRLVAAYDRIERDLRQQYHVVYHSSGRGVTDVRVSVDRGDSILVARDTVTMPAPSADSAVRPARAPARRPPTRVGPSAPGGDAAAKSAPLVIALLVVAGAVIVARRAGVVAQTHARAGFAAGLAIGLVMLGLAVAGGTRLLMLLALAFLGAGLVAVLGAERVFIGAILLNLPLQLDVYLGWREEQGALSAVAGMPISLTTAGVAGLVGWRLLMGMPLAPSASLRGPWARRTWMSLRVFVALSAVSILFASDVMFGFNELALLVQAMLLYGYLSDALRRIDLRWAFDVLLVGLIFEGVVMAAQALGITTIGATIWRADAGTRVVERVSGLLGSPNSAATYLSVLGVIALTALLWDARPRHTVLAATALLVSVAGLGLTLSRGGLLAFAAGATVLVASGIHQRVLPVRTALAIGAAMCVLAVVAGENLVLRIADDAGAAQGRLPLQAIAWDMFRSAPLTGVGLNNFVIALPDFLTPRYSDAWLSVVHNQYLLVAAESGIVALGAFLTFFGLAMKTTWEAAKDRLNGGDALLALGVLGALVARVVHMYFDIFSWPVQWDTLMIIVALGTALYQKAINVDHVAQPVIGVHRS